MVKKKYSQTEAICIFIARKIGGLLGKDDDEEYQILSMFNCYNDINPLISKLFNCQEKDEEVIKTNYNNVLEMAMSILSVLEKRYINNGEGKYYLGDKISLADFWLVSGVISIFFTKFPHFTQPAKKAAPKIFDLIDRLMTEDYIASFFKSEYYINNWV